MRQLTEQLSNLQQKLDEAEHTLNLRLQAPVPRDLDSLEHLVIQHKDFETNLKVISLHSVVLVIKLQELIFLMPAISCS